MSSKGGYPGLLDTPHCVVEELAQTLDNSPIHNWRSLVDHLSDYSQQDVLRLKNTRESVHTHTHTHLHIHAHTPSTRTQGGSPTKDLIIDLHSRGWTIIDLCTLARQARVQAVIDILVEYCQSVGLDPSPLLHSAESVDSWKGAKSCHQRAGYPATIAPPLHAKQEATKRYKLKSCTPSSDDTTATGLPHVSYTQILEATGGLDETPHSSGGHKLGEGGFGEVFYSRLMIGGQEKEAAVKVLRKKDDVLGSVNKEQFTTEINSLSRVFHVHLLSVLGYSCEGPHLCVVYPFLERGSLDKYITDINALPPSTRVGVAMGVASALDYLHTGLDKEIIVHRDVKSANILLSSDWTPKLGDFGVARIIPSEMSSLMTTTVVGTSIFMAPEYRTGTITPATDMYALGVVLFEMLTGCSAHESLTTEDQGDIDLVTYILDLEEEPRDILIGCWKEGVWQEVWSTADKCLEHFDFKRPTSKQVWETLHAQSKLLNTDSLLS
ncbi:interleukin-1 receptor-associated kinase 4-like isoform X2 [Halichondria panicea]|uniref:interleukin-1 receptor-associated kinase 4-like isoform X2 n=1 Tax=Halichondria panicea TaxID=6063 RepID=UPI00312B9F4F